MGGNRKPAVYTQGTQGSWFPSGYYGHFRSKHRNDFTNEYRQQAKPSPPYKFHDRIADRPTIHHFSHHDNRFSFLNTVTSFEGSLGKRKVQSSYKSKFIPDFIAWVPHKHDIQAAGPKTSVYRETFRSDEVDRVPQILVPSVARVPKPPEPPRRKFLATPFIDPGTAEEEDVPLETTYQLTHRHQQPNRNVITNMNTGTTEETTVPEQKTMAYLNPKPASIYERPVPSMTRRLRVASAPLMRSSVADCLVWHSHGASEESVQMLPAEKPRPKTVMGLLPELSTGSAHKAMQHTPQAPSSRRSSQSSHFGITPSATATVPMETVHSFPPSGMMSESNISHTQNTSPPEPTQVAMEA